MLTTKMASLLGSNALGLQNLAVSEDLHENGIGCENR